MQQQTTTVKCIILEVISTILHNLNNLHHFAQLVQCWASCSISTLWTSAPFCTISTVCTIWKIYAILHKFWASCTISTNCTMFTTCTNITILNKWYFNQYATSYIGFFTMLLIEWTDMRFCCCCCCGGGGDKQADSFLDFVACFFAHQMSGHSSGVNDTNKYFWGIP